MSSGIIVSLIFRLGLLVSWIWMARIWLPLDDQPGNNIGNFCWRHRSVRGTIAPIGMAKVRPSGNDGRAQVLIADESEKRVINNGAALRRAFAFASVTCGAAGCKSDSAPGHVAWFIRGIRRRVSCLMRLRPPRSAFMHQNFDLFVRQHSTRALCKGRHQ